MRQKRAKSYRKTMLVFNHTFKFRPPYQVILDHEIIEVCQHSNIDLLKYLRNTVQDEIKPMITQCSMQALYDSKNQEAITFAKTFERRRCGHKENAIDSCDCIESIVNINGKNKHRYVVVTQNIDLRRKLRRVPGTPLIYMNRSVMIMEPISHSTEEKKLAYENGKLNSGLNDVNAGVVQKEEANEKGETAVPKKKRKGPKEPNPLSIKKKRNISFEEESKEEEQKKKRKRSRKHNKQNKSSEKNQKPDNVIKSETHAVGSETRAVDSKTNTDVSETNTGSSDQ